MTKKLNESAMQSELSGSAFFSSQPQASPVKSKPPVEAPIAIPPARRQVSPSPTGVRKPRPLSTKPQLSNGIQRSNESTKQETNIVTKQRSTGRTKIRHTFDIFQDQLLALREVAVERERMSGQRVLLGSLVQEALDSLITNESTKQETNIVTKQRSTGRTKIRHTFDIFQDQLLALKGMVIARERVSGNRVFQAELVQEALDALLARERTSQ